MSSVSAALMPSPPTKSPLTQLAPSITTVIFDFDGTLCDSLSLSIELMNARAKLYRYRLILPEDVDTLRGLNLLEAIRFLKLHPLKIPLLAKQLRRDFGRSLPRLQVFPGMMEAIETLRSAGFRVGILSSNSRHNVQAFLDGRKLLKLFDFIQAGGSIAGKGRLLRKVMAQQGLRPGQVLYVGDEARDIQACRSAGIRVVSVTWGFNTRAVLAALNPDHLLDHPAELRDLITPSPFGAAANGLDSTSHLA